MGWKVGRRGGLVCVCLFFFFAYGGMGEIGEVAR